MTKSKGKYIDGFVFVVPKKMIKVYKKFAVEVGKVCREYGALEYRESIGDDLNLKDKRPKVVPFMKLIGAKSSEVVGFAWIVYRSKKQRDEVNAKMMKDKRMAELDANLPFDMRKVSYGGFEMIVEQ